MGKKISLLLLFLIGISFVSASNFGYNIIDVVSSGVSGGNVTNYYNVTEVNMTTNITNNFIIDPTVNETQFEDDNPLSIDLTWLTSFITSIINSFNFLTEETDPKWTANYSTFLTHITWNEISNGTVAMASDLIDYNSTGLIIDWNSTGLIKNWSSGSTTESDPLAYNGSLYLSSNPSNFITNETMNKTVDCSDITSNINSCTGLPFGYYGITPAWTERQLTDVSTTSNSVWSTTNLNFPVSGGTNYSLQCDILFTGGAATTGQTINLTSLFGFTANNIIIVYDTWSSATAKVGLSATAFNTALVGTGSGATIIKPNFIMADFQATNSGMIALNIRSEVSGSATTIKRGSLCQLYNVTAV